MRTKIRYTNYYVPGTTTNLIFKHSIYDNDEIDPDEELKSEDQKNQSVKAGVIFDAWRRNQNYRELISNLGTDQMSFQEMKKYYKLKTKDVDMDIHETSNKSTNSNLIKIIFYYFYKGWTEDKI